jgi:predicted nucleic acid-binding protein
MAAGRGGDLTSDAHVAALALEHGGTVYSQDADFARFPGVRWIDPLRNITT